MLFSAHVMNSHFAGATRYVALGDSLTEGLGDWNFQFDRLHAGWADRLAHLLTASASVQHERVEYANLAVRGSKTAQIMGWQLEAALAINPTFVTVMPGANDIFGNSRKLAQVEELLDSGLTRLREAGIAVLLVNTVSPGHIALARMLRTRTKRMAQLINRVGARHSVPVLDLQSLEQFAHGGYWCDDLAHFSNHGHTLIANLAAVALGLNARYTQLEPTEIAVPKPALRDRVRWLKVHVVPFLVRRVRGRTSGDGLSPKLPEPTSFYAPQAYAAAIRLEMATTKARQNR